MNYHKTIKGRFEDLTPDEFVIEVDDEEKEEKKPYQKPPEVKKVTSKEAQEVYDLLDKIEMPKDEIEFITCYNLPKKYRDSMGGSYVVNLTHGQATLLAQLVSKKTGVRYRLPSVQGTYDRYFKKPELICDYTFKKVFSGRYRIHNREMIKKFDWGSAGGTTGIRFNILSKNPEVKDSPSGLEYVYPADPINSLAYGGYIAMEFVEEPSYKTSKRNEKKFMKELKKAGVIKSRFWHSVKLLDAPLFIDNKLSLKSETYRKGKCFRIVADETSRRVNFCITAVERV